ncbi:hypothetical protein [Ornithinibacillus xuwenensis]|uniref:Solute-binding protein family 5 domain-containing protein n=1 Tax=Ornithinibacillus xuwenensis TaxID=3144668 RepID=A0ABU9XKT0_9BACI
MIHDLGYPRYQVKHSFMKRHDDTIYDRNQEMSGQLESDEAFILLTYENTPNEADITWIQTECLKHNIKMEIKVVPYEEFHQEASNADLVLSEYVAEDIELVALYNVFLAETSVVQMLSRLEQKQLLQTLYRKSLQQDKQAKLLDDIGQMEDLLLQEGIIMPLYSTYQKALFHRNLMGISINSIGLVPFKDLFYKR